MSGVRLRADKRFRRARVQPFGRRSGPLSGRVVRLLLALGVAAAGAYFAPDLLRRAEFLRVEHVVVTGNRHLSSGEVLALLDRLHGANILEVDLAAMAATAADVRVGAGGHVAPAAAGDD